MDISTIQAAHFSFEILMCIFLFTMIGTLREIRLKINEIAEPFIRRNKSKRISDTMNNMKKLGIAFSNMRELCEATDYTKTPIKQAETEENNIISGTTPVQEFGKPECTKGFHSEIITDLNGIERWMCVPDKKTNKPKVKRKTVRGDNGDVIGWVDVKKTTPKKTIKKIHKKDK